MADWKPSWENKPKVDLTEKIKQVREEFDALPEKGRYALGSKGVMLLRKIHMLECGIDVEEGE